VAGQKKGGDFFAKNNIFRQIISLIININQLMPLMPLMPTPILPMATSGISLNNIINQLMPLMPKSF
jgi:hypothetical protein